MIQLVTGHEERCEFEELSLRRSEQGSNCPFSVSLQRRFGRFALSSGRDGPPAKGREMTQSGSTFSPFAGLLRRWSAVPAAVPSRVPSGWGLVVGTTRCHRRDDALAAGGALESHGDAHNEGMPVEPNALGDRAPSQLAQPCSPSPPRGAPQGRAARRGQRAMGSAANFSRGVWC